MDMCQYIIMFEAHCLDP